MTDWHTHVCSHCGGSYEHEHVHTVADHPQDEFQCPFEGCSNFFKKGRSPRPPRNTRVSGGDGSLIIQAKSSTQAPDQPKVGRTDTTLTNWEKTVLINYKDGTITCKRADHFRRDFKVVDGKKAKYATPKREELVRILGLMKTDVEAACTCERDACRAAWDWTQPGILQTEFVVAGLYKKGLGTVDKDRAPRRVMCVNFRLSPAAFKTLHSRFPDWLFCQTGSGGHDHPVSHVTTQVVTFELFQNLRGKCLDLHGNPTANERRNSQASSKVAVDTYVNLITAKDFYRKATKWGPQFKADGKTPRWHTGAYIRDAEVHMADILKDKNVITGIHTGYYYQQTEILSLLRGCKEGATMELVMHRFAGTSGTFNDGELRWERRGSLIVQTNAKTGESYSHPCNEKWFQSGSWTEVDVADSRMNIADPTERTDMIVNPRYEEKRALTWSVNQMCDGVFKVSVVAIPAYAHFNTAVEANVRASSLEDIKMSGCVVVNMGESVSFPIKAEHAELFDHLRATMVACSRGEKKYQSHVNTVKAKCRAWAVDKKVPEEVDAQSVSNLIEASFWCDFRRDCCTAETLPVDAQWAVKQYDLALAGKSLNRGANTIGLLLDVIALSLHAKTGKQTCAAMLESFRLVMAKA